MKTIKKFPLILTILSFLTIFTPVNAEIKVVATIKPIHSLASYLMDGVGKPSDVEEAMKKWLWRYRDGGQFAKVQ